MRLTRPCVGWSDDRLVRACLNGDDDAWAALVDKYKRLIYSIAVRYGGSPEDCGDIFQVVCLELFTNLPRLRSAAALPGWIATVTAHQSFHWKRSHRRRADREQAMGDPETLGIEPLVEPEVAEAAVDEQKVRDATARLPPRCQEMIRLLFYAEPPLPYRDVAKRLGLATGSIGFIRGRCLQRLQKTLQRMGF
jgi:RNA polymerase sigma factor (sigma-70 family)